MDYLQLLESNPKSLRYSEINSYFESNLLNNNGSSWSSVVQEAEDKCEKALSSGLKSSFLHIATKI
jgi:hypothetical protein